MNKEEYKKFVKKIHANRAEWLSEAEKHRKNAELIEPFDPSLSSINKQLANAYEKFVHQIDASLLNISINEIDEKEIEEETMIANLFAKIKK